MKIGRKGSLSDLPVMLTILLLLVVTLGIIYYIFSQIYAGFLTTGIPGLDTSPMLKAKLAIKIIFDSIPFLFLGMGLAAIIMAFMIPTHPIFAPISFLVLAFYVIISSIFSNIFYHFNTNATFSAIFNTSPILVVIMQSLPILIAVIGFIIIIVQYGKVGGVPGG